MKFAPILACITLLLGLTACEDSDSSNDVRANLLLDIKDISFSVKDGRQVFSHSRIFRETNGVDLVITRGKVCVESKKTCVDAYVDYHVKGFGKLVQNDHHVATRQGKDEITFEYWAKDDEDRDYKIVKTLIVDGENAALRH